MDQISSRELIQQYLFYQREPWGEERLDLLFASITAHLMFALGGEKKDKKPFTVEEFINPWWDDKKEAEAESPKLKLDAKGKSSDPIFSGFRDMARKDMAARKRK